MIGFIVWLLIASGGWYELHSHNMWRPALAVFAACLWLAWVLIGGGLQLQRLAKRPRRSNALTDAERAALLKLAREESERQKQQRKQEGVQP